MKDKKDKRKHHESTIGKIIYSFLLFAPLLAIAVTCAYAIFNKNAYQSYSDKYIENLTQVTNANNFIENVNYKVVYNASLTTPGNQDYTVNSTNLGDYLDLQPTQYITRFYFINDQGIPRIQYTLNDESTGRIMNWQNVCPTFVFNLKAHGNSYINTNFTSIYMINETTRSISDVFYYAINKVEESDLFNWSKNTAIYTVLNNTSNTLGITNTFWPMLMAYWLIISVIYILYDIVLMMLVIFHRKVHCLQDSI